MNDQTKERGPRAPPSRQALIHKLGRDSSKPQRKLLLASQHCKECGTHKLSQRKFICNFAGRGCMGHLNNAATSHGQEGAAGTPLAILSLVRKPCYEPIPCSTRAQTSGDAMPLSADLNGSCCLCLLLRTAKRVGGRWLTSWLL